MTDRRSREVALTALYTRKGEAREKIERHLSKALGLNFEALPLEERLRITGEALELSDHWDEAQIDAGSGSRDRFRPDNPQLTELQKLLALHHEIEEQILDLEAELRRDNLPYY
jgi:methylphosphotriester-DNA--protein-cysteine methyltransferase